MPGSKMSRYRKGKRKYFKRKRKYNKSSIRTITRSITRPEPGLSVVRYSTPLPKMVKTTLRYVETDISLDPGAGGASSQYVFSANGIFDPNISGVGHQPLGFDQMMSMYDHAIVIGAKLTAYFQNTDGARGTFVCVHVQDNPTTSADVRVLLENGDVSFRQLGPATSGSDTAMVTKTINPNKYLGRSKPLSDPDLKNSVSSNPTEQVYFVLTAAPVDASDTAQVFTGAVIEYTVVFLEPKQLALS